LYSFVQVIAPIQDTLWEKIALDLEMQRTIFQALRGGAYALIIVLDISMNKKLNLRLRKQG